MFDCKDVSEQTNNYIDGEVSLILRIRFMLHLFICKSCRAYIQQIRNTIMAISILEPKEKDDTDKSALVKTLHEL